MRNTIIILIILLSATCCLFAQERNKLIIDFVNENYGEKVGQGICCELPIEAIKHSGSTWSADSAMNSHEIKYKEVIPGDIIEFIEVKFADGRELESHIAIVHRVSAGGILSIAEQNVATKKDNETEVTYRGKKVVVEKDSHVMFSIVDMNSVVAGKINFYRF